MVTNYIDSWAYILESQVGPVSNEHFWFLAVNLVSRVRAQRGRHLPRLDRLSLHCYGWRLKHTSIYEADLAHSHICYSSLLDSWNPSHISPWSVVCNINMRTSVVPVCIDTMYWLSDTTHITSTKFIRWLPLKTERCPVARFLIMRLSKQQSKYASRRYPETWQIMYLRPCQGE